MKSEPIAPTLNYKSRGLLVLENMLYNHPMDFIEKNLKTIVQILLLAVVGAVPFIYAKSLYFPYVSGKAYLLRILIAAAFFFWVWLLLKNSKSDPSTGSGSPRAESRGETRNTKFPLPFKNILVIALVLFFLAQVIAAFFGVDPLYSFFGSIERAEGVLQYGFWLLYFVIFISIFQEERDWKKFFSVFIIAAVLLSGLAWLTRALSPENPLVQNYPQLLQYQVQLHGTSGNPAYFAAYLLFAIGFGFLAIERRFFSSRLLAPAIVFFIVTLTFTEIRGAWAGLGLGVLLFSLLAILFLRKTHRELAYSLGAVVLAGLIFLAVLFVARDADFVKSQRLLNRITEVADIWDSPSVRERILNWNIALKAFKERPVFGYGPENYGAAFNKYYNFRIGVSEPWFDRAHNQPLDTLATGGIVVFSFYIFWILAVFFLIFKISKGKRILSFILAAIFLACLTQGLFLFDTLYVFLGLFPFLAYLVYEEQRDKRQETRVIQDTRYKIPNTNYLLLVPVALASLFIIYTTAFAPYKANAAVFQFFVFTERGLYEKSEPFLKETFNIESPYSYWEVRKRAGWQFSNVLEFEISEKTPPEKIEKIKELYSFITTELEKFIVARPTDPQIYYVLGRIYRLGYEKLGFEDLDKSEAVFQKALERSDVRVDYFSEYAKVLVLHGKFEEGEKLVKDYVARVDFYEYFPHTTLGHFYFVSEKYEQAFEEYEKARAVGYSFFEVEPEYARYLFVAEKQGEYERVVDMAKAYLERWGPDADTYFNIAVGYLNLGDKESAREFFSKALELEPEYEKYNSFFLE